MSIKSKKEKSEAEIQNSLGYFSLKASGLLREMFVQARAWNEGSYWAVAVLKRTWSQEFCNGCSIAGNHTDVQWSPEGVQTK